MIAAVRLRAARLLAACPSWQAAVGAEDADIARAVILDARTTGQPDATHAIVHQPTVRLVPIASGTWSHETAVEVELWLRLAGDALAAGEAADALCGSLLSEMVGLDLATPCTAIELAGPAREPGEPSDDVPRAGWFRAVLTVRLAGALG